eukprot:1143945-Rhodomonas_salina.1
MKAVRGLAFAVLVNTMRMSVAFVPSSLLRLQSNLHVAPNALFLRSTSALAVHKRPRHLLFASFKPAGSPLTRPYASTPTLMLANDAGESDKPAGSGGKRGIARLEDAASIKEVKEICAKLEAGTIDEPAPAKVEQAKAPAAEPKGGSQPAGEEGSDKDKEAIKAEREARKVRLPLPAT